jgi:hypothetical protein
MSHRCTAVNKSPWEPRDGPAIYQLGVPFVQACMLETSANPSFIEQRKPPLQIPLGSFGIG